MSGPKLDGGSGGGTLEGPPAAAFVDGGSILIGKLVSTLLGGVWLTVVAGWVAITNAIVQVHITVLDTASATLVRVIQAFGLGGARTLRLSWGSAFRAAVDAEPLLAPLIFSAEIVVVSAFLLWARRRWT